MAETAALFSVSELTKNFSNASSTSTVFKKKDKMGLLDVSFSIHAA